MLAEGEVEVAEPAIEPLAVVRSGGAEAAADLQVTGTGGGWPGLTGEQGSADEKAERQQGWSMHRDVLAGAGARDLQP